MAPEVGPRLALSAMTVPGATFAQRVEAAAAADLDGVGLRPGDRRRAHADGLTDADLRALLHAHGIEVVEIDVVSGWGGEGAVAERARAHEDRIHALADAVGGRSMTVVGDVVGPPARVAEAFAGLCDRAAAHGLDVGLEYLPWTTVPDLASALRIVQDAGRANGKVVVDSWHHFRGDGDTEALARLDRSLVAAVQIDDAGPRDEARTLEEETFDRLLPGQGTFDLTGFLRALGPALQVAPLCVEVISPRMDALPVAEAVALAGDATRAVMATAGLR